MNEQTNKNLPRKNEVIYVCPRNTKNGAPDKRFKPTKYFVEDVNVDDQTKFFKNGLGDIAGSTTTRKTRLTLVC